MPCNYDFLMLGYIPDDGMEKRPTAMDDYYFSNTVAYLVSFLVKNNISTDWIENIEYNEELLKKKLTSNTYKAIGISSCFVQNSDQLKSIIAFIGKYAESKIIIGGTYVQYIYDDPVALRDIGADYYINSTKGETATLGIIQYEKNQKFLNFDVPNVIYFENGIPKYTRKEEDRVKAGDYSVDWSLFKEDIGPNVAVRTAVSCPFKCKFCAHKTDAGFYEYMSADKVIQELDQLDKISKVRRILFTDNTLNIPQNRFDNMLDIMIEKQYHFDWVGYVRCQFIDDAIAEKMKKSGCHEVFLGLESGSNYMLRNMNKQTTVQDMKKGIQALKKHGIKIFGLFLIGFPGETEETAKETLRFIQNNELLCQVQPWLNVGNALINLENEEWNIRGGLRDWTHKTMDFDTANKIAKYILEQTNNI